MNTYKTKSSYELCLFKCLDNVIITEPSDLKMLFYFVEFA